MLNLIFFNFFIFIKKFVDEGLELQFGENFLQFVGIGCFQGELFQVERNRQVGLDGGEGIGDFDFFGVLLHFFLDGPFQFVGTLQKLIYAAKLVDQFHGRLLPYPGTSREIVGRVAHECQQVYHLLGCADTIFLFYLFGTDDVVASTVFGFVHAHMVAHQLSVVLVGCHHIGVKLRLTGFRSKGSYHIICLKSV